MALLLALTTALGLVAHAGDVPQISVEDDGTVVGRMLIDAPSLQVRQVIPQLPNSSSNVLSTEKSQEGSCVRIFRRTRGLWEPLELRTRMCPTSFGWRESLIQSEDFNAYESEWTVRDQDGKSSVQLRVRSEPNLMVPSSVVRTGTVQGVNETFAALLRKLVSQRATP